MKKAKRVTKREKKAMIKFLEEMKANQPQQEPLIKPKARKVRKTSKLLTLTKYLERKAQKKHDKAHHREEKRDAKAGREHKHDHEHK